MQMIMSKLPAIIYTLLKYLLYTVIFGTVILMYILMTETGNKIGYFLLSDRASEKSHFDIKVTSLNLYSYPHVSTTLLIEDQYTFALEGEIKNFKQLDMNYSIKSSTIEHKKYSIEDKIDITGTLYGGFKNIHINGNGTILDGDISYTGVRKRRSVDNLDVVISDINTTKLLALFGEDELFKGSSNAHIHFDTLGKYGKKGHITYDVKDNNYSGVPLTINTRLSIIDDNQTFSMHLETPTASLDVLEGTYDRKKKYAQAKYILDVKELHDIKELINVKAQGPFLSTGNLIYDKKINLTGTTDSLGGLINIIYTNKHLHLQLNDVPFQNLMYTLTQSPVLDANIQGDIHFNLREKSMYTKLKLKETKIIQKDIIKLMNESFDYDVTKEDFNNSSFEANFKDKKLSTSITIANKHNYLNFKDTTLDTEAHSINTIIDFKINAHHISGNLYARNDGHLNHTLDSYLRFDGYLEKNYHVKLSGALSNKWANIDYSLSSTGFPSHITTIQDDVNITGHLYGPYKRLLITGKGTALDGHINFDGVKNNDMYKNIHIDMNDIRAEKLYTLLGQPTLPEGKASISLALDYLHKEKKNGTLKYSLKNSTYKTLPLELTSHVDIHDNLYTFTAEVDLNKSKIHFNEGIHDSTKNTTNALYHLDIKELITLEALFGHTYEGPFYSTGSVQYKDEFLVRGSTKSLGGITDFLYKEDILYVDFNDTSLKSVLNLFSYPKLLDAKANGSVNYHYKKDLILVNTKLNNTQFLPSDIVNDAYKNANIYLPDERFDDSTLEFTYQNDILLGSIKLANKNGHIFITDVKIDTDKKLVNAYFDVNLQQKAFTGKIYGPLGKPELNLNMQKLIRHEMDKQLDSMVGQENREMMESMPMGDMSKDVASGVGGAFMGIFF